MQIIHGRLPSTKPWAHLGSQLAEWRITQLVLVGELALVISNQLFARGGVTEFNMRRRSSGDI
jgi:hypothetical protein